MTSEMHRLAYSLDEVAEMLGFSRAGVEAYVAEGTLPSTRVGGRRLVHWTVLDDLLGGALSQERGEVEHSKCLVYTMKEVTKLAPLSLGTVQARVKDGTIPSITVGDKRSKRLIRRDLLDSLLRGRMGDDG